MSNNSVIGNSIRRPAGSPASTRVVAVGRLLAAALLALVLAACSSAAQTQIPGGPLEHLPSTITDGTNPAEGGDSCVVENRSFDDDVTVPKDLVCTFNNVTINGNLILAPGARVDATGGHVDGNVLVYPNAKYVATGTSINGNVQAERATLIDIEDVQLNGNVQTWRTASLVVTGGSTSDIQPERNGTVTVVGVQVDGNIQPEKNTDMVTINNNRVYGDVQPKENTGGVTINNNEILGNLQCESNVPAPTGSGNTVHGDYDGQCSTLR